MKFLISSIILFFYVMWGIVSIVKAENIEQFFLEEEKLAKTVDFTVKKAKANFNFIGGFADGEYKLSNSRITHYKGHIYMLYLEFYKKKGSFRFTQKLAYPFWYDGKMLVFKTPKGKIRFKIAQKFKIKIEQLKDRSFEVKKLPVSYKITLPAKNGKVELVIAF